MLQCNRYPGLDANEIIRLTSAIGHNLPFKFFLHSCHSSNVIAIGMPEILPVRTIIAYADSLFGPSRYQKFCDTFVFDFIRQRIKTMSNFDPVEIRSSIKWYFESKNVSLRKALQIRGPLSAEQHNDIRVFYSQYLISLVSAVDALLEKEYPFSAHFQDMLYREFVIDGYADGEQNYAYLKELRNSVVHRGEDIAGRGTLMASGLHLLHVPPRISTRSGKVTYQAFSPLLLGIAALSESSIGGLILRHFQANDILRQRTDFDTWRSSMQAHIKADLTIPDFVKQLLPSALSSIDLQKVEEQNLAALVSLLSSDNEELLSALQEIQAATCHAQQLLPN